MRGAADLARRLTDPENADRKKPVLLHRPKGLENLTLQGITSFCRDGHPH